MAVRVAIGLGSNLGDRPALLRSAVEEVARRVGPIVDVSSVYETAPVGGPEQDPYLNAVVVIDTGLAPGAVLSVLRDIEADHGRVRRERWGPRTLDLDLLLYGDQEVDEPGLIVPHPRMTERRFVLEPLVEAWPAAALPDGTPVAGLLHGVADQAVHRWSAPAARTSALVFVAVGVLAALLWIGLDRLL